MNDSATVRDNGAASRFELVVGNEVTGEVTYHRRDGALVLDHTEINDEFSGQGMGSKLARGVFDTLAERGDTAQLKCPYLERWIGKHPEYAGLVSTAQGRDAG